MFYVLVGLSKLLILGPPVFSPQVATLSFVESDWDWGVAELIQVLRNVLHCSASPRLFASTCVVEGATWRRLIPCGYQSILFDTWNFIDLFFGGRVPIIICIRFLCSLLYQSGSLLSLQLLSLLGMMCPVYLCVTLILLKLRLASLFVILLFCVTTWLSDCMVLLRCFIFSTICWTAPEVHQVCFIT
jgi:hypothetical protein